MYTIANDEMEHQNGNDEDFDMLVHNFLHNEIPGFIEKRNKSQQYRIG